MVWEETNLGEGDGRNKNCRNRGGRGSAKAAKMGAVKCRHRAETPATTFVSKWLSAWIAPPEFDFSEMLGDRLRAIAALSNGFSSDNPKLTGGDRAE